MPKILNISKEEAKSIDLTSFCKDGCCFICITDVGIDQAYLPEPKGYKGNRYQFNFNDCSVGKAGFPTTNDFRRLRFIMQYAEYLNSNILVQCDGGLCRSGAVVEVGILQGYEDPRKYRVPNIGIKNGLLNEFGKPYDPEERQYVLYPPEDLLDCFSEDQLRFVK